MGGNFATCGETMDQTSGTSKVNLEIIRNLSVGQGKLAKGECASARTEANEIQRLMLIPLIQGTLRYAWKTDNEAYSEKAEAEGVVFALSVVPVIKKAFESTYECMGIDGAMVGGLYDAATGNYFEGAEPAGTGGSSASAISMAVSAGVAAATSLFMFL